MAQNFERWLDLRMVLCHFMNAGSVMGHHDMVGALESCLLQSKSFELFVLTGGADTKPSFLLLFVPSRPLAPKSHFVTISKLTKHQERNPPWF